MDNVKMERALSVSEMNEFAKYLARR